ncbi:MAG: FmdB family zinc ribbon protein [Verrucomicrobiota bacterium]
MPTYEYLCSKCGHQFEKHHSMSEEALAVCPKELCGQKKWGKGKVKKLIGAGAGLIFKGSGFYITDYRSDKYKDAAKKDTASSEPKAATNSSETKPAETKPAKTTSSDTKPASDKKSPVKD